MADDDDSFFQSAAAKRKAVCAWDQEESESDSSSDEEDDLPQVVSTSSKKIKTPSEDPVEVVAQPTTTTADVVDDELGLDLDDELKALDEDSTPSTRYTASTAKKRRANLQIDADLRQLDALSSDGENDDISIIPTRKQPRSRAPPARSVTVPVVGRRGRDVRMASKNAGGDFRVSLLTRLKHEGQDVDHTWHFRYMDPLEKLLGPFCDRYMLDKMRVFMYFGGQVVDLTKSPEDYNMTSGCVLDMKTKMTATLPQTPSSSSGSSSSSSSSGGGVPADGVSIRFRFSDKLEEPIVIGKTESLLDRFCATYIGLRADQVVLRLDGDVVKQAQTIESLDLEEGDLVEAQVLGGVKLQKAPPTTATGATGSSGSGAGAGAGVSLKVRINGEKPDSFMVGKTESVLEAFRTKFAHRISAPTALGPMGRAKGAPQRAFRLEFDGENLTASQTPESLDMEDEDLLDATV